MWSINYVGKYGVDIVTFDNLNKAKRFFFQILEQLAKSEKLDIRTSANALFKAVAVGEFGVSQLSLRKEA